MLLLIIFTIKVPFLKKGQFQPNFPDVTYIPVIFPDDPANLGDDPKDQSLKKYNLKKCPLFDMKISNSQRLCKVSNILEKHLQRAFDIPQM